MLLVKQMYSCILDVCTPAIWTRFRVGTGNKERVNYVTIKVSVILPKIYSIHQSSANKYMRKLQLSRKSNTSIRR